MNKEGCLTLYPEFGKIFSRKKEMVIMNPDKIIFVTILSYCFCKLST